MSTTATVGAFEAKTNFSELLKRVKRGESITITHHEKPVARLVPIERPSQWEIKAAFQQLAEIARRRPLNPPKKTRITYRQLIEEGRR